MRVRVLPEYCLRVKKLVYNSRIPDLCKLPYPGHPSGCPNYGKKPDCPPQAPFVTDILDVNRKMYLVYSEFDLESHVRRMKEKHPDWSDRQLRNVIYWQGTSKSQLRHRALRVLSIVNADVAILKGEAHGVNLYVTCSKSGLKLERIRDLRICHHVALVGWLPENVSNLPKLPSLIVR